MGKVRYFELNDIEQVIELNIKSFVRSKDLSRELQYEIFREVCFNNPWYNDKVRSLVYEDSKGNIKGFLAVIPRDFIFMGQPILVGVAQHLMVDQVPLASLQLFKEFFSGPQDLSITDMAVDIGKPLWERLGGTTIYLQSIYWRRPLKILSFLNLMFFPSIYEKKYLYPITSLLRYIDNLISKVPISYVKFRNTGFLLETFDEHDFLSNLENFIKDRSLKPLYTHKSISWLFRRLELETRFGEFQKVKVLDKDRNLLGWFLYNLLRNGTSNVIQIVAYEHTFERVLNALFYDASSKGTVELVGRLDPYNMKTLFNSKCLFMPGRNWMLAHSNNRDIINSLHNNNVFFSRLEGDLWFL